MIYKITKSFPKEELFGITSQMRRAAVSITSSSPVLNSKFQIPNSFNLKIFTLGSVAFLCLLLLPKSVDAAVIFRSNSLGLSQGLVGYWSFDGGDMAKSGGSKTWALDRSGNANHGIATNMATSTMRVNGKLGQALDFDGSNDYVDAGNGASIRNLGVSSYSFWIFPESASPNYDGIMTKTNSFVIDIQPDNSIEFYRVCDSSAYAISSANGIITNAWQHVVAVWDGTCDGSRIKIYINGILQSLASYTTPTGVPNTTGDQPLKIGYNEPAQSGYFNGQIDEVRVYNRALTAQEVKRLYNQGASKINKTPVDSLKQGLVGYWSFDGGDMAKSTNGVRALDRSGQGNNGRLSKMATTTSRVAGKLGQALEFDGVDDVVDILPNSIFEIDIYTVCAWIYPKSLGESTNGRITNRAVNNNVGAMQLYVGPILSSYTRSFSARQASIAGTNARSESAENTITFNVWQHVCMRYDDGGSRAIDLFYNGSEINVYERKEALTGVADIQVAQVTNIGNTGNGERTFDGRIDEVRIYNRALSSQEIKRLYNQGASKFNKTPVDSLKQGLVGYWTFDGNDINGTRARDASGNNNQGTLTNGPLKVKGKLGQALEFDGANDYVNAGNSSSINGLSSFTYSAWIYPESWGEANAGNIISQGFLAEPAKQLRIRNDAAPLQALRAYIDCSACTNASSISSANTITLNEWQHVIMSYDNNGDKKIRLYRNGIEMSYDTQTAAGGNPENSLGSDVVWIGDVNDGSTDNGSFDGLIDEVRAYDRALSAEEVRRLYNMGR